MSLIYNIGLVTFLYVAVSLAITVWKRFIRKPTSWDQSKGQWAVVTGASGGIGLAYSRGLAKRGVNVVLVSRNLEVLEPECATIEKEFKVKAKAVKFDFSKPVEAYKELEAELKDLPISVLINNVGGIGFDPEEARQRGADNFWDFPAETFDVCTIANVRPVYTMMKMIEPQMSARKFGRIINVSSLVAVKGMPKSSPYAGSKAYIDCFTRSMRIELENKGVYVESHCPGNVLTNLNKTPIGKDCCAPEVYAERSLDLFGTGYVVYPWEIHALEAWLIRNLPEFISMRMLNNKKKKPPVGTAVKSDHEKKA